MSVTFLATEIRLVLDGRVRGGRHLVRLGDRDVPLTGASFQALAELVRARLATATGLTPAPRNWDEKNLLHQTIHRLRLALDGALGCGMGAKLVVHAARSRYLLDLAADAITVDPSIRELVPCDLAPALAEELLRTCPHRDLRFVSGGQVLSQ